MLISPGTVDSDYSLAVSGLLLLLLPHYSVTLSPPFLQSVLLCRPISLIFDDSSRWRGSRGRHQLIGRRWAAAAIAVETTTDRLVGMHGEHR